MQIRQSFREGLTFVLCLFWWLQPVVAIAQIDNSRNSALLEQYSVALTPHEPISSTQSREENPGRFEVAIIPPIIKAKNTCSSSGLETQNCSDTDALSQDKKKIAQLTFVPYATPPTLGSITLPAGYNFQGVADNYYGNEGYASTSDNGGYCPASYGRYTPQLYNTGSTVVFNQYQCGYTNSPIKIYGLGTGDAGTDPFRYLGSYSPWRIEYSGPPTVPISSPILAKQPMLNACETRTEADPVDCASGTFMDEKLDIEVTGGRVPFQFVRSYRTLDDNLGSFGVGTSHNFDIFLQNNGSSLQLKMQNNVRFDFIPNSAGTAFINSSSPEMLGSAITQSGGTYTLRLKTGSIYTFNSQGFLTAIIDRNSNRIDVLRDDGNAITQIKSVSGSLTFATTRIIVGAQIAARIDKITDQAGRFVDYKYNGMHQLIGVTYQDGLTKLGYTYDPTTGAMTSGIDARGITFFQNSYYPNGRVMQQTQPVGRVYNFAYTQSDPNANLGTIIQTQVTNPNGNVLTHNFNSGQYPTNYVDPAGKLYQVNLNPSTNLIGSVVDPLNHQYSMGYDALGNLKTITNPQITDPNQRIATINYEPTFNLPISATDYLGKTSTITREANGNPTRILDPLGHGTTMSYTAASGQTCSGGQVCSIQNDVDGAVSFNYDTLGQLIQKTAPLNRITQYFYDEDGVIANRLTSIKDPLGRITRFTYDALDRVTQVTNPDNSTLKMVYDPNGNLKEFYDENQGKTTYNYDNMNRLTKRTNPLGQFDQYTYDFNNNIKTHIDRKGRTTTYKYDQRDDLIETDLADGTILTYTYDDGERLLSVADSANGTITWQYDALDRIIKETTTQGIVQYGYDNLDRRTSLSAPNGYAVTYFYDNADRLNKISRNGLDYLLGYDNADRLNRVQMPNTIVGSYSFDTAGRLSQILYQKGTTTLKSLQYSFDVADQLKQITGVSASPPIDSTVTSTSVNANNQYLNVNGSTLQHDQNGNLSSNAQTTYQWDVRDRLIGLSGSGVTASFSYDALGRRKSKTVNGATTTFLYDGSDILQDSTATYLHGPGIDNVFSRTVASSNEYFLKDHLGSTIALTDGTGNVSTQYAYSAYGKATKTGTSTNYFTYTGREDDGTGFYFYRARYYSPDLKRFVAEDPIGFAGGQSNLYSYVGGNPISFSDPSGENAIVSRQGNKVSITIPIDFNTDNLSGMNNAQKQAYIDSVKNNIQNTWSGQFGNYDVTTNVVDASGLSGVGYNVQGQYNSVILHEGSASSLTVANGYLGNFYTQLGKCGCSAINAYAHEAGHFMGLDEKYNDLTALPYPGWERNIMSSASQDCKGKRPDKRNIQSILQQAGLLNKNGSGTITPGNGKSH
jgi:RHS repeat-associated protein